MDISLPDHLDERLRWLQAPGESAHDPGEFVLYWMHNALRAHENPALDVAICLARQNGLPMLVYHGLNEQYPYASDRHHSFMLQGHRDVQRELADRGITAAFHLQRHGKRGPYLRSLTRAAAVLISEEMPVQPLCGWMERLVSTCTTPIATVDCSCIAPVMQVDDAPTNDTEFRLHLQPLYEQRLHRVYQEQTIDADVGMCDLESLNHSLGLEPLSLQDADLAALIGQCRIDHSIAPVADTPGGTRAGYRRWDAFKRNGLMQYSHCCDNPTLALDGCSRMSAYLHYGMVSPFRIAREAATAGARQYLDELLTWREMAFHFCYHHRDVVDTLEAVPDWAQQTLAEHRGDPREENCSWETLARAATGRPLWDTAQRCLLRHGELQNTVRKTWGKALLPWLHSPDRALQLLLDLNHRFSLDGRNPSSYGGVLWCFGQFDQPCQPEQPVIGRIRHQDIDQLASQMDMDRFRQIADRPIAAKLPRVAVIGAGIAGLAAARTLVDYGIDVSVFDQADAVGGRAATLSIPIGAGDSATARFDHGAQYFTARDSRFCRLVQSWIHDGLAEPWMGRIVQLANNGQIIAEKNDTPRYVGAAGMSAVAEHLAADLCIEHQTAVIGLSRVEDRWELEIDRTSNDAVDSGLFDVVISSCPPATTAALFQQHSDLAAIADQVTMRPCWAVLLADPSLNRIPFDGAFVDDSPIGWIAKNGHKPGHGETPTWVAHASAAWSQSHRDASPQDIIDQLTAPLEMLLGKPLNQLAHISAHLWSQAMPANPLDQDCLFDAATGLGACGDWCGGTRIEAAYLSGIALAGTLLRRYTIDRPAVCVRTAKQPSSIMQ
ncbi:NAD(P)-binding protein [Stieleria sp. TO1_6]|uniref:NAD(P)-binding protein n=1 Tax=Stieleria tagensis TaxID=2956795 RepID=UPI00209AC7F6|nr:NAD(P)-binding protein [Stieleria tagensis]MCO8124917.1 NAD(P)-binding protein [Stieleria tagensis]